MDNWCWTRLFKYDCMFILLTIDNELSMVCIRPDYNYLHFWGTVILMCVRVIFESSDKGESFPALLVNVNAKKRSMFWIQESLLVRRKWQSLVLWLPIIKNLKY